MSKRLAEMDPAWRTLKKRRSRRFNCWWLRVESLTAFRDHPLQKNVFQNGNPRLPFLLKRSFLIDTLWGVLYVTGQNPHKVTAWFLPRSLNAPEICVLLRRLLFRRTHFSEESWSLNHQQLKRLLGTPWNVFQCFCSVQNLEWFQPTRWNHRLAHQIR